MAADTNQDRFQKIGVPPTTSGDVYWTENGTIRNRTDSAAGGEKTRVNQVVIGPVVVPPSTP